jgi:aldehyde dehydrogenase (NAD+)
VNDSSECSSIPAANGKTITHVAEGTAADVDTAVRAAHAAYSSSWGMKTPGGERGRLLFKLAEKMEEHAKHIAAIEALDNGKTWEWALKLDVDQSIRTIRYYAGWADKNHGKVIETYEGKLSYTRHEPIGVVGQIIPWNFPGLCPRSVLARSRAHGPRQ